MKAVRKTRESHARHTAVGTLQGFIASALSLPTGLLTAGFLTRKLGPEGYGLLTVTASTIVLIETITTLGFRNTAVKLVAEAEDWKGPASRALQAQLLVSLGAAALLVAFAPALALWFDSPELPNYLRLYALDIPISATWAIHSSILAGRGFFGRKALLTAVYWLSRMVFIFVFVGLGLSVASAIVAGLGASTAVLITARLFVRPALFGRSALPFGKLWNYALPLFFHTAAMHLFKNLDLMFVKALSGNPEAAGYYGAARNLAVAVNLLTTVFSPLLLAKLTQLAQQDQREYAQVMSYQTMRLIFWLLPFAGMATGAAKEIAVAIYGRDFLPAGSLLQLLVFASIGTAALSLAASMLTAAGRPKLTFALSAPLVPLALIAHSVLVPRLGPIGAAATTTGLSWVGAGVAMLVVCRVWRVLPPGGAMWKSVLICGAAYILSARWPAPSAWLLLKLPVVALVIVLAFLLLGEFRAGEIALVRSMLRWRKA